MRKVFCVLLGIAVIHNALALQIKNAVDNETIAAKISGLDVTRIFVEGDRIQSVKGVKGTYTRENDEKNGEIYIQPTATYQRQAFTILIKTEQGRHFTLLLTPTATPAETLMLVPKGVGRLRALHFEKNSAYDLTLIHLIRAMKNGALPEGYNMQAVTGKKQSYHSKQLTAKVTAIYQGLHFQGEIIAIKNLQFAPISIDEREFITHGTCALSVDAVTIPARSTVYLYRVVSHG